MPSSIAQDRKSKWDISVSYGVALPVGDFKQTAPAKNIEVVPSSTPGVLNYYLYGIAKDGNSYATNGQFGALDVNYHIGHHWLMSLALHHSRNSVNTQSFYDYANTILIAKVAMVSNKDNNVTAWSVGFGYEFYHRQLRLTLTPVIGQAGISSPDYVFEWFTYPYYFDVVKLSNSLLLGLHGKIGYEVNSKFYTSIKFDFDSANFNYTVKMHSPGTNFLFIDDRITYRIFKLGLTFGMSF
ncbi:MAG: hypothetical protein WKF87_12150 [Chryseolinea sp.]